MDKKECNSSHQDPEVRKGPWTMEEDMILINYIANHGEGVWNSLAKSAGLKRTGKSCRLRWLNYLRPDVRRGNITHEEQLLIIELHEKWGNRLQLLRYAAAVEDPNTETRALKPKKWSKIAKHLPGRTDNEIKNYWRTRIQKHIMQTEQSSQQQINDDNNQIASTSQISNMAEPMETDISPPTYQGIMEPFSSMFSDQSNCCTNDNNYWGMEDLLSMQLLNGD